MIADKINPTQRCESSRPARQGRPQSRGLSRKIAQLTALERNRIMDRLALLKSLSFGSQVAEEEVQELGKYFVEADQWNRIVSGEIDIVRGEKGTGKSAIYLLLSQNSGELFDRRVLLVNAENPKGSTVFKDLVGDPPISEAEFIVLWKIYILVLITTQIKAYDIKGKGFQSLLTALEEAKLIEGDLNLSGLLRSAQILARRLLKGARVEAGVELDQISGTPSGIIGRIALSEPSHELRSKGINSIDGYLKIADDVLAENKFSVWVLLDRLDVAFAENHNLEANALRALLRVYGDFRAFDNLHLKIFLREDIWKRITEDFREASHLIRYEIVEWSQPTLPNLIVRRILNNDELVREFELDRAGILASADRQIGLFDMLFPAQVEQGPQKAQTFKWMVTRCADGKGKTAPRELIHLLKAIKDQEVRRLENGGTVLATKQLFDRSIFKLALPTISDARLKTYIFAEYPSEKRFIEKISGQKTEQTPESLSALWEIDRASSLAKARELVDLGFFEERGTNAEPTFWIPFLYRDALKLVQGKAEAEPGMPV